MVKTGEWVSSQRGSDKPIARMADTHMGVITNQRGVDIYTHRQGNGTTEHN